MLANASEVAWSPKEDKLVCEGSDGYYLVVNANNRYARNRKLIIPYGRPFLSRGVSLPIRWSPDGKYIVFCKEIWYGLAGIYVIPVDNPTKHIRISTSDYYIIGMSWSN